MEESEKDHFLLRHLLLLIAALLALAPVCLAAPTYDVMRADATWTHIGGGVYEVSTGAEDYANEVWERSAEDGKITLSGSTMTTTGKYYAYGDLAEGSVGSDATYLYAQFITVGDFFQEPGSSPQVQGLKGKYLVYFGLAGDPTKQYALVIDDGTSVNDSGFASAGKVYQDSNGDVPGAGVNATYDSSGGAESSSDGFENELSAATLLARRSGLTLEMELELASIGLSEADLADLSYMYLAIGISNPSSPQDLFANDHFSAAFGSGVEYDTLHLIPEPGTALLLALGLLGLARPSRLLDRLRPGGE